MLSINPEPPLLFRGNGRLQGGYSHLSLGTH